MSKETIAKNTIFLYFRMILTMLVTLFTSRVILQVLGVEDFGIYQAVGGVVALLSFLNTALSAGSSRFLTFELGKKDLLKLRQTFSSILIVHTILGVGIIFLAETAGLWFIQHKLIIPADRFDAAITAYHFSVLTIFFSITQVPYNAAIISHEKMAIYAYLSILEVILKLAIVYLLLIASWDKLKVYAILLCIVQIGIALSYRLYCKIKFSECHGKVTFDSTIVKSILTFSSWNLLTNTAAVGVMHGTTVLINIFFTPGIVAARAIANQVNGAANQLVQNFRNAVNPQIIKKFANDDIDGSKKLLLASTKISFFLMLFLCIPICFEAETLLRLWLKIVPDTSVPFLRLILITTLFQTISQSFYTALSAKGQIRENAISTSTIGFCTLFIIYILFKIGFSPISLAWSILIEEAILALLVKPFLVVKIANYKWEEIANVFVTCFKVSITAIILPLVFFVSSIYNELNEFIRFSTTVLLSTLSIIFSTWFFGLDSESKKFILQIFRKMMNRSK